MRFAVAVMTVLVSAHAFAQATKVDPESTPPAAFAGIWAGGLADLMTQPKRDVTASFGAIASWPLFAPPGQRASAVQLMDVAVPRFLRQGEPRFAKDTPALVALCAKDDTHFEALFDGGSQSWSLKLSAETLGGRLERPLFMIAGLEPSKVPTKELRKVLEGGGATCFKASRDSKGELLFDKRKLPVKVEPTPKSVFPEDSKHLLDLLDAPDAAMDGVPTVDLYAHRHPKAAQPRREGVLFLAAMGDAVGRLDRSTVVATSSDERNGRFLVEGRNDVLAISFENGAFTTPQLLALDKAFTGPLSLWSWSTMNPKLPAQVVFDRSAVADACLDRLPSEISEEPLALRAQRCFDLALPDAGPSFTLRRERWTETVSGFETSAAARVERFCQDQASASSLSLLLPPPVTGKDVGPLMTTVLGWEPRGAVKKPGSLKLPENLSAKFAEKGFMELPQAELDALASVDLSFFKRLAEFDRWELTGAHSPLDPKLKHTAAEAPLPEFSALLRAAQLHFRRAVKTDTMPSAARDVRQAARLAFTTETLVGQNTAVGILAVELRAYEWAKAVGRNVEGWTPYDEKTLERLRRIVRTAPCFWSAMVDDATFARVQACDRLTRCAALTEVSAVTGGLQPLLREPWRARQAARLQLMQKPPAGCSGALARYWASKELVDVAEAKRSRLQELISGAMLGAAAQNGYQPDLEHFYP